MDGRSRCLVCRGHLACHCILVEPPDGGLILIDTGLGLRDVHDPKSRLSAYFLALLKPEFRQEMTARRQVERLGFRAEDVRHIVLTHLDFDHAGGLDDFPNAVVHLIRREKDAAEAQATWMDRQRFRPQQWSSRPRWRVYDPMEGEAWYGFARARPLDGLPPEIALIPLIGHTLGHAGVAVQRSGKWLLQAGDAYFYHEEMRLQDPHCTPGLRFYQWMLEKERAARFDNQRRLRELVAGHADEVDVCCGHDLHEFERLAGRIAAVPASALRASR
ncbi:glyoxylase-like metal-dependent hydrolase (beta-lactamase superfamily II) [Pigmentiphaga litoralis]|uniref:Glyoxylase-like metal-dependent hydrolase (Beta-lactamase superfamily II) n=2 Tax=Pigmentiphaga litoralis TaxID=516702 RepID=A0A7Y9ITW7_9BURK|nr:glyoxylase-like metal-dependent hydrolase (beta-lactamase superfamily II) [Pigmentiphaga litoralis]NYE82956.1 glyoxylase-like metal-dependent hydrolase (beta-lactamase superfamily II) [Pigmentiphaga litoralis]